MMRRFFLKAVTTLASGLGLTDPRLYSFMGGGPTNSGEAVSPRTAMQIDTVWACVRLIAQTIATLPLSFFLMDEFGRGTTARDHPLWSILHDKPNGDMTAVTFWEAMVAALLLWGNAYSLVSRNSMGTIVALTPLLPDRLTVRRGPDGALIYRYQWVQTSQEYGEDEIFHIKGFSLDGVTGMSPIGQARETLGIAVAAEKSAASFFKNAMRPAMALVSTTYLTDTQRERFGDALVDKFTGSINTGRTPIVEGGWTIQNLTFNPDDAQLLATRGFSVEQICRFFGVAPVMVGHNEKTSSWGSGLEQMNLWFLTYTLRPVLRAIEQEISRSLLTPVERMLYYAEFNVEGLMRADSAGRASLYASMVDHGLATRNEIRAKENMPPMEGGDDLTVQSQMIPISMLGKVVKMGLDKSIPGNDQSAPAADAPANGTR